MLRIQVVLPGFLLLAASARLLAVQPIGLILEADGTGRIERLGANVRVVAAPGTELYPGDVFKEVPTPIRFAFCPQKSLQTLPATQIFQLDAVNLPASITFTDRTKTQICELPDLNPFPENAAGSRRPPHPASTPDPQVAGIDDALKAAGDAPEVLVRIARADRLYNSHLPEEAVAEYDSIRSKWPGASWSLDLTRTILDEADRPSARAINPVRSPQQDRDFTGKTYALIIGTSQYEGAGIPQLKYAAVDAESFSQFLESERGGRLIRCHDGQIVNCNIKILTDQTDQKPTLAAVSNAFETFIRAHRDSDNRLIIFIAGHGVDPTLDQGLTDKQAILRQPIILTRDSAYSDTKLSGYLMKEVNAHASRAALAYGRVVVFVDVCHAYNVGNIRYTSDLEPNVEMLLDNTGLAYFMASAKNENSWESPSFGKGHGAFTYAVLEAMSRPNLPDRPLTYGALRIWINNRVPELTNDTQNPPDKVPFANLAMIPQLMVHLPVEPLTLGKADPMDEKETRMPKLPRGPSMPPPPKTPPRKPPVVPATLGPDEKNSAWQVLQNMRTDRTATAEDIEEYSRRLQIALEDRGQQALIQYLQGDELEPKKETFTRCASDFKAARELAGISVFDESRELFCRGRALIFDKQFEPGERALLESIHLDSKRSYSYNALGIAYLEQATKTPAYYDRARAAFETAIRYAPYWTYPWHNMALLYTETGNYEEAIRSYRHAMDIDPSYSYLPYNLGLLYQRLNRKADARQSYELAFRKADEARRYGYLDSADGTRPQESMAHNAMGALAADRGRWGQAQKLYRDALQDDAKNLDARHNLALLLTRGKKPTPAQRMEAEDLWNTVLGQDRDNIPARLARARYEVRESELNTAITDYQELIRRYPDLQPARREVVDALVANHEPAEAFATLKGIRNPTAIDIRAYHRIAAEAVSQNDEVTRSAASGASQKLARELSHVP